MKPSSVIELSESALRSNLRFLRRVIGPEPKFCSVVKGDAYGHRIDVYVPLAEKCGVRRFAVFSAEEAADVLAASAGSSSIMIMGTIANDDLGWAIENDVAFFVFDLSRLDAALRASKRIGKPARVHLEVETGLYRTGLEEQAFRVALRRAAAHPENVVVEGICTHFSGAESSANYFRIGEQQRAFEHHTGLLAEFGFDGIDRHVACSAAVFNYPDSTLDLVRVGIAQYGYWPSEETRLAFARGGARRPRGPSLTRVMRWKSRVMNLKSAPMGAFIGYGLAYQAMRRMRLASVPVGYAHGIPRAQSNVGHVLIRGCPCRIVGTVNMNMMTVDVTDVPGVKPGDEVVLLGHQGDREIEVGAFGERTHNLTYEVLVRLSSDIPREVIA